MIVTTRRIAQSPVSTPQTLEPEWCSLVVVEFPVLAASPPARVQLVLGAVVVVIIIIIMILVVVALVFLI